MDNPLISTKVRVPAQVTAAIATVFAVLGIVLPYLGVEMPEFITEDVANEAAIAVFYLLALTQTIVGYVIRETNPAPSARDAIEATGRRVR